MQRTHSPSEHADIIYGDDRRIRFRIGAQRWHKTLASIYETRQTSSHLSLDFQRCTGADLVEMVAIDSKTCRTQGHVAVRNRQMKRWLRMNHTVSIRTSFTILYHLRPYKYEQALHFYTICVPSLIRILTHVSRKTQLHCALDHTPISCS